METEYSSSTQSSFGVNAIDYKGAITLKSKDDSKRPLLFSEVSLLGIHLGSQEKNGERDNFTLQAKISPSGALQAKGKVQLKPLTVCN